MTSSDAGSDSGDPLWGSQTDAAIANFSATGRPMPAGVIAALARIKRAAARVNGDDGTIDAAVADALAVAAGEVVHGEHADQFPVDVLQTGSGTSTNMNMNEVLATLASRALGREVHPNDDANASQSSNDVMPSAVRIAALTAVRERLVPAMQTLEAALRARAAEHADVPKAGRTHLMDATPVMLGDELGGYAAMVEHHRDRLAGIAPRLGQLPVGGTATGTGLNARPGFAAEVAARLADETGLPLREAPDHFAVQGSHDDLVELSGLLRGLAVSIVKIADDLRWMASGPRAGLGEISIPALQAGSSIMPGKSNPVICEVATQAAAVVIGHDATVAFAGSQGAFELNTYLPVIADALLGSVDLLAHVCRDLADHTVARFEVDVDRCRELAERSPATATGLTTRIGYDRGAEVVRTALAEGLTIREAALRLDVLPEEELDELLDVDRLARGESPPA